MRAVILRQPFRSVVNSVSPTSNDADAPIVNLLGTDKAGLQQYASGTTPTIKYSDFTLSGSTCPQSSEATQSEDPFSFNSGDEAYVLIICPSSAIVDCIIHVGLKWTKGPSPNACLNPAELVRGESNVRDTEIGAGQVFVQPAIKSCGDSGSCTGVEYSIVTWGERAPRPPAQPRVPCAA